MSDCASISISLPSSLSRGSARSRAPCWSVESLGNYAKLAGCLTQCAGGSLLYFGIQMHIDGQKYKLFGLEDKYSQFGVLGLTLGLVLLLFPFSACCAFLHISRRVAVTLGVAMFVAFILSLLFGICGIVHNVQVKDVVHERIMNESFMSRDDAKIQWNELEHDGHCCGVEGPYNYVALHFNISQSCCSKKVTKNGTACTVESAYEKGCYNYLNDYLRIMYMASGSLAVFIACLEILGVMFYFLVVCGMNNEAEGERHPLIDPLAGANRPEANNVNQAANMADGRNEGDVHPGGETELKKRVAEWVAASRIVNGDPDQDDLARPSTSKEFIA